MRPYAVIDLHCDTLVECSYTNTGNPDTLNDPTRGLSLTSIPGDVHWGQLFAIYMPERGQAAKDAFEQHQTNFYRQMEKFSDRVAPCRTAADMERAWAAGKTAAVLAVEDGAVLAGEMDRVAYIAEKGVRAVTLVWNTENEIGSGNTTDHGLTPFGKAVIPEMEKHGILVDVSHLNDNGFCELLEIAQKPFIATHSNARAVCGHKRNLTDVMIGEMVRRKCLIGLNYYVRFLEEDGNVESLDSIYRHAMHILDLGGEKCLSLGSDFDGSILPQCLNTPEKVAQMYGYFLDRGIPQATADGIFYRNALEFFRTNL